MRRFNGERTSYLSHARANDDEAYRSAEARRQALGLEKPKKSKPTIELYEYTPTVELLAQLYVLLQQNVHASYTHGSKAAKKKPKITHYPTPSTSARRLKKAAEREALAAVESVLVFTDEPYEDRPDLVTPRMGQPADYADAVGELERGSTGTAEPSRPRPGRLLPPDRSRAEEGGDVATPHITRGGLGVPQLPPLFSDEPPDL